MELAGEVIIGVSPHQVWAALNDPEVLRQCIPGCEEVQQISPVETHTRVLLKMGPVRARFVGKILMSEVRPDEGCTLDFEGSGGAAGFARGRSVVNLVADQSATRLHYSATASIGGKLGQIGGRMIDASAKQMADQFFNAFRAHLDGAGADAMAGDDGLSEEALPPVPGSLAAPAGAAGKAAGTTSVPFATSGAAPASASAASAASATTASAPAAHRALPATILPLNAPGAAVTPEYVRVLWFVLGMASTGFGVWLAGHLAR